MKAFLARYKKLHIWLAVLLVLLGLFLLLRNDRELMNFLTTKVTAPLKDAVAGG